MKTEIETLDLRNEAHRFFYIHIDKILDEFKVIVEEKIKKLEIEFNQIPDKDELFSFRDTFVVGLANAFYLTMINGVLDHFPPNTKKDLIDKFYKALGSDISRLSDPQYTQQTLQ